MSFGAILFGTIIGGSIGVLAGIVVLRLHHRLHRLEVEITELQAAADLNLMSHGSPPLFAPRYDLEIVIDPTKMAPPGDG